MARVSLPSPPGTIVLYSKPDCHLCDETRLLLGAIIAERIAAGRPAPAIEERNILDNERWHGENAFEVPVLALGSRRLPLATSASRIRAFLASEFDGAFQADTRSQGVR
jgi:hypothetical protein